MTLHQALPNILTISRIVVLPGIVVAFYLPGTLSQWLAGGLFAFAALTDFVDGYLARRWEVQSHLGRILDPIADKLLVAVTIVMLVAFGHAALIPALLILGREIFVSGLREFLAEVDVSVPVSKLAKAKTALQMGALFVLILGTGYPQGNVMEVAGNVCLWVAALLTLVTGYAYFRASLPHLDE